MIKKENKVLMREAREALEGRWEIAVLCTIVFYMLSVAASFVPFGGLLLSGSLAVGSSYAFMLIAKKEKPVIGNMFMGFDRFFVTLKAFVLMVVYILLWSILFIIPGIIAMFAYSQVFFILAEDKNISASDALRKSKEMMVGNKWKSFCLCFRFIGWIILSVLTLGLGLLLLYPYMQVTYAKFYEDIKGSASQDTESAVSKEDVSEIKITENSEEKKTEVSA